MENYNSFRRISISFAVMAALWAQSGESQALTACQSEQVKAAKNLIYKQSDQTGLIGCDIQAKKKSAFNVEECQSKSQGTFADKYAPTTTTAGCSYLFEKDFVTQEWSGYVKRFSDPECGSAQNNCADAGKKRRRSRTIDTVFAQEAEKLLDQCGGATEPAVSAKFNTRINNLENAPPNLKLLSQDFAARRLALLEAITGTPDKPGEPGKPGLCKDILSRTATSINVPEADIPGGPLLNIVGAQNGATIKVSINVDESNFLKSVQQVEATWASSERIGSYPKESNTFKIVVPKETIKSQGGDHENKEVKVFFKNPDPAQPGAILETATTLPVDITPPQAPTVTFPTSVTLSRDKKILKVNDQPLTTPTDKLDIKATVTNFRGGDAKTAEATQFKVDWNGKPVDGFDPPTTGYEPLDVKQWAPEQSVTAHVTAAQIARETPPPQQRVPVKVTATLIDGAGNASDRTIDTWPDLDPEHDKKATAEVTVIHQPPTPTAITPEGDAGCATVPGVYNLKANADPARPEGNVLITLPAGILGSDQLSVKYRNSGDSPEAAVAVLDRALTEGQVEARTPLNFPPGATVPNAEQKPDQPNGLLTARLQNGGEPGDAKDSAPFFVDLVKPDVPKVTLNPFSTPPYDFTVTKGSGSDSLTITQPAGVTCNPDINNDKVENCTYTGQPKPRIIATTTDWACNSVSTTEQIPPDAVNPEINIVGDSGCGGTYNANADSITIIIPNPTEPERKIQAGDVLEISYSDDKQPAGVIVKTVTLSAEATGPFAITTKDLLDNVIPPNPTTRPSPGNATLRAKIMRGTGFLGEDVSIFFADLVAPNAPTINPGGDFDPAVNYTFTVVLSNANDQLKVTATTQTGDSTTPITTSVNCVDAADPNNKTEKTCTYVPNGNETALTLTATASDWACNESPPTTAIPKMVIPTPAIVPTLQSCTDKNNITRRVYNISSNAQQNGGIRVTTQKALSSDSLVSSLTKPTIINFPERTGIKNTPTQTYRISSSINLAAPPSSNNGQFASHVKRGTTNGPEAISDFLVDLVAPVWSDTVSVTRVIGEDSRCAYTVTRQKDDGNVIRISPGSSCQPENPSSPGTRVCTISPGARLTVTVEDWACNQTPNPFDCPSAPPQ